MNGNVPWWVWLLLAALGAVIWCLAGLLPCEEKPEPIIIEGADHVELGLSPMPKPPTATPRPLIEYPNTASTHSLIKAPSELEEQASEVLPRPLIEYSNSALSAVLEALPSALVALPRPLVEYANSGATFALEPLTGVDFSHVQPRPLVEHANAGWIMSLSPPTRLLEEGE